jgi:hypothetical protein
MPCAIRIASQGVDRAQKSGPIRQGRAQGGHGDLVRHGHDDPVHIADEARAPYKSGKIGRGHMGRRDKGIVTGILKHPGDAAGDFTWAMGSPTMKWRRVAPSSTRVILFSRIN